MGGWEEKEDSVKVNTVYGISITMWLAPFRISRLTQDSDKHLIFTRLQASDQMCISPQAKWRFSAILKLPWRPRLAAAGATTYVFDKQTGLVVEHIEEWDVEAQKASVASIARFPSFFPLAAEQRGYKCLMSPKGSQVTSLLLVFCR